VSLDFVCTDHSHIHRCCAFPFALAGFSCLIHDAAACDVADAVGLLHGVPDDDNGDDEDNDANDGTVVRRRSEKVERSLGECVDETRPGGRIDAVQRLTDILSFYTGLRLE